jgi:DNA-binding MarR family transcriptional regulator
MSPKVIKNYKLIGRQMDIAVKEIRHMYTKTFKEHAIDLTIEQWPILAVLYDYGSLSQVEIADNIMRFPQSLSATIKLLIKKSYVIKEKSKKDKRSHNISLTQLGKEIVETTFPHVKHIRKQQWDNLSEEDYDKFFSIIEQIRKNVN